MGAGFGITVFGRARQAFDQLLPLALEHGGHPLHLVGQQGGAVAQQGAALAQGQQVAQPRLHLRHDDRLGQEIVATLVQRPHADVDRRVGGDHHHRDIVQPPIVADVAQQFHAVHIRHHLVQKDQVGLVPAQPLDGVERAFH